MVQVPLRVYPHMQAALRQTMVAALLQGAHRQGLPQAAQLREVWLL